MKKKNLLGVIFMGLFLATAAYAQDSTDQGSGTNSADQSSSGPSEHHHGPSQAAIDACSGKAEGDTCDYTNAKGDDKSGTCANSRDNQLFCKRTRTSS
jgi:hypothetical protein